MKKFLSIIIPVYNIKEEYLRNCFDSLLAQDKNDFDIIIVDDGSTKYCAKICDEYKIKDQRINVVHQKNLGVSVARNAGMQLAKTEWVTFVDPDDWVEPNYIQEIRNMVNNSNSDIYLFDYFQEFSKKSVISSLPIKSGTLDNDILLALKMAPFDCLKLDGKYIEYETNTIWNKIYKLDLLRDNNLLFDAQARKGQDVIFNAECYQLTNKIYYYNKPLYHYRYLEGSVTNKYNRNVKYYNEIAYKNYERIITKYSLPQSYINAYYTRVLTRLYSCMRLYYFHPENDSSFSEICIELNKTLNSYPYNTALEKVNFNELTNSQKVFIYFLRSRNYYILNILVQLRIKIRKLMGFRLKQE